MQPFTTRPEIRGTFGVVASTHWIASAVGMSVLERGGTAFDAAAAAGFVLQIVEPHLNGPGGDLVALVRAAGKEPEVICGQGVAPAGATLAAARAAGLKEMPGSGLYATVVPGAFDGWMTMLRDFGTWEVSEVLAPAIQYAAEGHPVLQRVSDTIKGLMPFFSDEWPTSLDLWCPDGNAPEADSLFCNPQLAETYTRLSGAATGPDRVARIDTARQEWAEGFIAEAIDEFAAGKAFIAKSDLVGWRATREAPLSIDYHGWTVSKTGPWGQGPVLLQALSILRNFDLGALDPMGPDFVHLVVEAMKLAYADREAFYADPAFAEVPMETLLSAEYGTSRAAMIGETASLDQRPGTIPGFEAAAVAAIRRAAQQPDVSDSSPLSGEPTMAHLAEKRGDTCHVDVIDRWGNAVAATPSGGWLQSSPTIPGLGFALNSRAQMFWLEEGAPTMLRPGARPRTTLTPTIATHADGRLLAFGTPGGDQQDQWQLVWFLRFVHHGMNMQQAMDAPLFHTSHFQGSFAPRRADPGSVMIEPGHGTATLEELGRRGHRLTIADPWTVGRLTATLREPGGLLRAAATPRLMQAYAIGR